MFRFPEIKSGFSLDYLSSLSREDRVREINLLQERLNQIYQSGTNTETDTGESAGNEAYQNLTNPTRFPSQTSGRFFWMDREGATTTRQYNILFPFMTRLRFPKHPIYYVKADIDSIYGFNSSFENLIQDFSNPDSMLVMKSTTCSTRSLLGSRFFIDTRKLGTKPTIRGKNANKIGLEKFPSLEIGQLSIGLHRPLSLHLVNLSATKIFKTNMFTKKQMAVVNAALNIAREKSISYYHSENRFDIEKDFLDFHPFKSCYGNKSNKTATRDFNELTAEETIVFARNVQEAIKTMAEDNIQDFLFYKREYHQVRSDEHFQITRGEMVEIAQELHEGAVFVASISGIKKYFNKEIYQTRESDKRECLAEYNAILMANEEQLVDEANEQLLEQFGVQSLEDLPEDVLPFETRDIRLPDDTSSRALELNHINSDMAGYVHFKDTWEGNLTKCFTQNTEQLSKLLDTFLKKHLGIRARSEPIFFDMGIEVRVKNSNSLLIDPSKAFPKLMQASNTR